MFKAIQMRGHGLSFDVGVQPTDKCWATVWCKSRWIPLESTDFLPIYSDVTECMIFPFRFTLDLFPVFHNSVSFHCVQKQPGPDLDLICIGWKQLFQTELRWIYNCINKGRIWSIPREDFPGRCCVRTLLLWWSGALPLISTEKFHLNPGLKPWTWAALHIQGPEAPLSSRRLSQHFHHPMAWHTNTVDGLRKVSGQKELSLAWQKSSSKDRLAPVHFICHTRCL